jgi:precorrin-3B synthase
VLAALGDWSGELGNGRMELTGRGNLQLRGLRPGTETELAVRLGAYGLLPSPAHDRARNVVASPLSGRDGHGAWDVRPLVGELDRRLCADPGLAELPGRFLFALDDGRGDVAGLGADATLLARPDGRAALLLAGLDTGLRPVPRDAVGELLAVAREFLRVRADERVWRVAELPGGPLSLVAGLSPAPGPLGAPERIGRGPVGRFAQLDGRVALGVGLPLGELDPDRCRLLASCAVTEIVLTPWRGVVLPDLDPAAIPDAAARLAGAGLLVDADAPLLAVTACTGRPGCGKALADVRADALAAVPTGQTVHWSGCARRCGRPAGADVIDIVAEAGGYRVSRAAVAARNGGGR